MAKVWMHNGFLQVEGEKMSKSLGNFVTIHELLETEKFGGRKWPGEVLRLAMLRTHYRQPIDWTVKGLEEAEKILADWARAIDGVASGSVPGEFIEALGDDLNFAKAEALLHVLRKSDPTALLACLNLIGQGLPQVGAPDLAEIGIDPGKVEALMAARLEARKAKNFAESDRIRDELAALGILLKDGKDKATGEPITSWEVKR
jgi:cysteinyl-tRNA synthetase